MPKIPTKLAFLTILGHFRFAKIPKLGLSPSLFCQRRQKRKARALGILRRAQNGLQRGLA